MNKAFNKYGKSKFKDIISVRHPLYISTMLEGTIARLTIGDVAIEGFRVKGITTTMIRYKKAAS
ncbi:hypothetical protein [Pseudoalteromonas phage AL]|nr:hypothetical protein [Pseudoalteromonas phage AL]